MNGFFLMQAVLGHTGRKDVKFAGRYLVERENARPEAYGEHPLQLMSQPI